MKFLDRFFRRRQFESVAFVNQAEVEPTFISLSAVTVCLTCACVIFKAAVKPVRTEHYFEDRDMGAAGWEHMANDYYCLACRPPYDLVRLQEVREETSDLMTETYFRTRRGDEYPPEPAPIVQVAPDGRDLVEAISIPAEPVKHRRQRTRRTRA